jgi:hypothetical protein
MKRQIGLRRTVTTIAAIATGVALGISMYVPASQDEIEGETSIMEYILAPTIIETETTETVQKHHETETEHSIEEFDVYNRPLLKENELLPEGTIIAHEDDTIYTRQQLSETELYDLAIQHYGDQAKYYMYDITIDNVDLTPEEVIPETSKTQAEEPQEIETEEITVDEAESSESSEEVPEEPYYVEEHLDPETDQRYVEESPLWLLAHIMMSEAGYCDSDERLKVGSVVLNRMNHPAFPDTMVEVLYCDNPIQYAPTICPNRFYQEPTEECWADAQWLLDNGSILPGDVVYQATFPQGSAIYEYSKWGEYFCYY